MHCFNHQDHDALAICRNCGRALCSECIAISEDAVACKNRCEQKVATLLRATVTAPNQLRLNSQFGIISGILFVTLGIVNLCFANDNQVLQYSGAVFIGLGLLFGVRALKASQLLSSKSKRPESTIN
jgi:hypothetical protein